MEDMNAKVIENEEIEDIAEVEEAPESSNSGALVAGIVGGFIAYAVIGGAKKLRTIAEAKWAAHKAAKGGKTKVVDAEFTEVDQDEMDSDEKDSTK